MTGDLDVVIAGGGRVGIQTARILTDRGHTVRIVERDKELCEELADEYIATVIQGDASYPEILEQVDIANQDVIAALTGESGMNLAICMAATDLAPDIRTVARVENGSGDSYRRFVDAICFPERAGARIAANEIVGNDVQTLADVTGTLDIMLIRVEEGAPAAGKQLSDVRFPSGSLIISDDEGERVARPDTVLNAGKQYVVATEPEVADEVMNLLRG